MNANSDNHEPASSDELHDRLLDRALAEVVGGETPPDLSGLILAERRPNLAAEAAGGGRRLGRRFWATLAVAAMLLVAALPLVSPSLLRDRGLAQNRAPVAGSFDSQKPSLGISTVEIKLPANSTEATAVTMGQVLAQLEKESLPQPTAPMPPVPIAPGESQVVQPGMPATLSSAQLAAERGLLGPVQIQYLEGANLVIIRGREADAERVKGIIRQMEEITKLKGDSQQHGNAAPTGLPSPYYMRDDVEFYAPAERYKSAAWGLATDRKPIARPESGVAGPGPGVVPGVFPDEPPIVYADAEAWRRLSDRRTMNEEIVHVVPGVATDNLKGALDQLLERVPEGADALRPDKTTDLGTGPGSAGDKYVRIFENPFIRAEGEAAVSTFSIDVDTASYANVRRFLLAENTLPPPDAVRLEELVNYFKYNYAPPKLIEGDDKAGPPAPFSAHLEVAGCPWNPEHRLVRIGIKGQEMDRRERPQSNLVFLVDVSGSMSEPLKLPLVIEGLKALTRELGESDRVAIVVYAQVEGLALPSTKGSDQAAIIGSLSRLRSGGSTAGGAGIQLAYQVAEDHFIKGGTNRIILCTDGDFNVGVTSPAELERVAEKKAKDTGVFLSVLGFGRGNLNDQVMEGIADHGNGNYHYVDSLKEARRVLVEEMSGTLVTIAKDVKIQVEFNPKHVAGYRLLGYENRMLRREDFNDDTKDAGEIGAGHTVTALYEVVPAGKPVDLPPVDALEYQQPAAADAKAADAKAADISRALLTLKVKYKRPEADKSEEALSWRLTDDGKAFGSASTDFQFASAVAGFGMLLRDSKHKGNLTYAAAIELAQGGVGSDEQGYRRELVEMIKKAKQLRGE